MCATRSRMLMRPSPSEKSARPAQSVNQSEVLPDAAILADLTLQLQTDKFGVRAASMFSEPLAIINGVSLRHPRTAVYADFGT